VQVGEVVQAYQDTYTPKGSVVFKPIKIEMYEQKIDQAFNPTKLYRSWLGFLTNNNVDRTTWPFVKWFVERVLKQADKDLETKGIYNGVFDDPEAGVAGAAINAMDGVKKIINDGINDGGIVPIATGAFSTTPAEFVTQIEAFIAAVPEEYRGDDMTLNLRADLLHRYQVGRKAKYNMNYEQETNLNKVALYDNITLASRLSMKGSDKIWMTPKWNAIAAVKGWSNKNALEMEKVDRTVKLYTDWFIGVGFLLQDQVYTNDVELGDSES
jgi:hypothetical protein